MNESERVKAEEIIGDAFNTLITEYSKEQGTYSKKKDLMKKFGENHNISNERPKINTPERFSPMKDNKSET